MAKKKKETGSWIVTMRCTVTKEVVVDNCTREQAEEQPWDFAIDENETGQIDWDVENVEPNV